MRSRTDLQNLYALAFSLGEDVDVVAEWPQEKFNSWAAFLKLRAEEMAKDK